MLFINLILLLMVLFSLIILILLKRNYFTYACSRDIIEDISQHYMEAEDIVKKSISCEGDIDVYAEMLVSYNSFLFNFRARDRFYFIKSEYRESFYKIINKKEQA